ncbi:MAG TPA: hypothetical protein VGC42_31915, partial [Kofleriaceae bacterium]
MATKAKRRASGPTARADKREAEQLPLLVAPTPPRKRKPKLGRPKKGRAGAPHKVRPVLSRHHPVHVVLRVVREVG